MARPEPWNVVYPVSSGEGAKTHWVRVGIAFPGEGDGDGINVYLDAIPINFDGRLFLRREPKEWKRGNK